MRAVLILSAALAALTLSACDKGSSADSHLKEAGAEAKAAVSDVGKAIDASVPAVKDAGAKIGDGIKNVGAEAAPDIKAAGRDIKDAADKGAGDEDRNPRPTRPRTSSRTRTVRSGLASPA